MFTDVVGDLRRWQVEAVGPIAQTLNTGLLSPTVYHGGHQHVAPRSLMRSAALTAMAAESAGPSCSIRIVAIPMDDGRLRRRTETLARRSRQILRGVLPWTHITVSPDTPCTRYALWSAYPACSSDVMSRGWAGWKSVPGPENSSPEVVGHSSCPGRAMWRARSSTTCSSC